MIENIEKIKSEVQEFANQMDNIMSWNEMCEEFIEQGIEEYHVGFCIAHANELHYFESKETQWKRENFNNILENIGDVKDALKDMYNFLQGGENAFLNIKLLNLLSIGNNQFVALYHYVIGMQAGEVSTYLTERINIVYGDWISKQIRMLTGMPNSNNKKAEKIVFSPKAQMVQQVVSDVYQTYAQLYDINLMLIKEISGMSYETKACSSVLCFLMTEVSPLSMEFESPISFKIENARLIRKMLEMPQEKQCLVLKKIQENAGMEWAIMGIAEEKDVLQRPTIVFRIFDYMHWVVEINNEVVFCYKRGNYKVEHVNFTIRDFKGRYEEVFEEECSKKVYEMLETALNLEHGLSMIFVDKQRLDLLETGSGIERYEMAVGFKVKGAYRTNIKSMSAIDGTILLDSSGECLKFGVILNTAECGEGENARGSRYNSVLNFVKNCKKENVATLAVVISDDKTVNIIDTKKI